eukprot:GHVQ01036539.1.p1 GENE.GHVQ01036539.1~~GHVQ01036539.1.p1  ORF type:complete len:250 (+),score=30.52 GHVQ01036539.1:263-1012(+)
MAGPGTPPVQGYRVTFVGNTTTVYGHTEYIIHVRPPSEDPVKSWFVNKRYREIRELHDHMKLVYPEHLSWFPAKRLFRNMDSAFVEQRQRDLQKYMTMLLSYEPLCTWRVLREFLNISPPISAQPPTVTEVLPQKRRVIRTEANAETLVESLRYHLLDLSQPCEQFIDMEEAHDRKVESVALGPSFPLSAPVAFSRMYERLSQLAAISDPTRPITGASTVRADFPSTAVTQTHRETAATVEASHNHQPR